MTPLDRITRQFIRRFRCAGTIRIFTQGCCYWFAFILKERFHGTIMYHEVDNHFACLIGNRLYDITGPLSSLTEWQEWERYKFYEPANANRVIRDCLEIVSPKSSSASEDSSQ